MFYFIAETAIIRTMTSTEPVESFGDEPLKTMGLIELCLNQFWRSNVIGPINEPPDADWLDKHHDFCHDGEKCCETPSG